MAEKVQSRVDRNKQKKAKKRQKKQKNKFATFIKRLILVCIIVGLVGVIAGISTFAYYASSAPKLTKKELSDPIPSVIKDKNNKVIARLGAQNRKYITYDQLPHQMENAILSTEDARFYKHHGIDPIRIGGAVVANIKHGFGSQGASTLTQQVVTMALNNKDVKTLKRKSQEAWLAIQLERHYTKHEILEMYVNKVYLSDGVFGFETAAEHYFGKSLSKLSLPQMALLAGMPQGPNLYNPFEHPDLAKERRDTVLSLMYQHHKITKSQMDQAMDTPITKGLVSEKKRNTPANKYPAFVDEVINEMQKLGNYNIYSDGLTIYTTLDARAQKYAEKILNTNSVVQYPDDKFQAGFALVDTKTGEIRALGGGRNRKVESGFNYAVDTRRSPGSTIKPILDYGPAIQNLKWSTGHILADEPTTYRDGTPINDWDNSYQGNITMRKALYNSRNIPALKTFREVGSDDANKFAKNLGFNFGDKGKNESASIGGGLGVSPLQMAGAYAAFGNDGVYNKPHAIRKIVLRDGVTEIKPNYQSKVAMSDYTAYMITDMLKDVLTKGTGTAASIPGLPVAGKTGTTNFSSADLAKYNLMSSDVEDSWFTGYTTKYALSVWTGYNSEQGKKYGITAANQKISQQIFRSLMSYVSEDVSTPDFTKPKSVIQIGSELYVRGSSDVNTANKQAEKDDKKEKDKEKDKDKNDVTAPTNISASYDKNSNQINVSWGYSGSGASFTLDGSIDGSKASFGSTSQTNFTISNPKPGSTYVISVTASADGKTSKAASASVTVPSAETTNDQTNNNQQDNANNSDKNNANTNDDNQTNDQNSNQSDQNSKTDNNNGNDSSTNTNTDKSNSNDTNSNDNTSNQNQSGQNNSSGSKATPTSGTTNKQNTETNNQQQNQKNSSSN
ncbi:PBP1A family penicillin-binding protein [Bacillus ginsengihumi]|uniref:PBP1A family penicillin-binding protein n=1 Tax=Heyndrickxia ginsengihumi TaxID=363870 RepID=A0A6M0P779_9BACI|nr:penicillin-binding protein 1A [Heyndrickxia ginsengihumi]NEY20554.1 PBP1A family penicillin-binding protein [Heyndrickxia ginsengihumi]